MHPDDPRGPSKLPTYITSPKPKEKTLDKARKVIERLGYPERVATSELYDEFGITDSGRMLYFLGYTPSVIRGQRGMRLWDAPPELDARFMNEVQDEVIEVEEETEIAATQVFPDPEPDPEPDLLTIAVENTQLAEPDDYLPPQPMDLTDEEADAYDTAMAEADRIEFLDERDSWVVDLKELLGYTWPQVEDKLKMLGVLGMDYEFRVWRKR